MNTNRVQAAVSAGLRFHTDGAVLQESASSILLALCLHMDKTKESVKDLFSRIGKEVSLTDGDAGAEARWAAAREETLGGDQHGSDRVGTARIPYGCFGLSG